MSIEGTWPGLRLGRTFLLRPGHYTLTAEREGYAPLRAAIDVGREPGTVLRYRMEPLPGRLRIDLPVPGEVTIDGRPVGKVPGEFDLRGGNHRILIGTERHLDYAADIRIEGYGKRQVIAPKLTPAWAVVDIATEPAGASVRVGDKDLGTTPLRTDLMAGTHRVMVKCPKRRPYLETIEVQPGESEKLFLTRRDFKARAKRRAVHD